MKTIIKYEIISLELGSGFFGHGSTTENDFTDRVNERINEGFQPFGELKISVEQTGSFMGTSGTTRLTQIMVKYE